MDLGEAVANHALTSLSLLSQSAYAKRYIQMSASYQSVSVFAQAHLSKVQRNNERDEILSRIAGRELDAVGWSRGAYHYRVRPCPRL